MFNNPKGKKSKTKMNTRKTETIKYIIQIAITILTAIGTSLGVISCTAQIG